MSPRPRLRRSPAVLRGPHAPAVLAGPSPIAAAVLVSVLATACGGGSGLPLRIDGGPDGGGGGATAQDAPTADVPPSVPADGPSPAAADAPPATVDGPP